MSENNNKLHSLSECKVKSSLKVDEDLLCIICTELVDQAKQVDCCGGLFCAECIEEWMKRQSAGDGQGCPQCRAVLKRTNIMNDVRSDRKSAAQLRRCPFYEHHYCAFVGTRQEVAEHNPDICSSQNCKTERARWNGVHAKQERSIQLLVQRIESSAASAQQSLLLAALKNPDDILRDAGKFDGAKMFTYDPAQKHYFPAKCRDPLSSWELDIKCYETGDDVALFCYRSRDAVAPSGGFQRLKVTVTLISFEPISKLNFITDITVASDTPAGGNWGYSPWLSLQQFKEYVKDGKFALGWTVAVEP